MVRITSTHVRTGKESPVTDWMPDSTKMLLGRLSFKLAQEFTWRHYRIEERENDEECEVCGDTIEGGKEVMECHHMYQHTFEGAEERRAA